MNSSEPENCAKMDATSPNRIYRWESASGLEHTCFACSMKANNPKARQTCYGIHSIPCSRYHQTMHAIGTSHNCFSCIQADELHENRHRKIAELLVEYRNVEEGSITNSFRGLELRERNVNIPVHAHPANEEFEETDDNDESTVESSSTSRSSGNNTPKLTKSELRAQKRAYKDRKSQNKAVKNQMKHTVCIKTEDVDYVGEVLHGSLQDQINGGGHPLATDKNMEEVIERNMSFVAHIHNHQRSLMQSVAGRRKFDRERTRHKKRSSDQRDVADEDDEIDTLVEAILAKFGVQTFDGRHSASKNSSIQNSSTPKQSKAGVSKAEVIEKLKETIKDDLLRNENELRETCVRAGGFWRYVGRPVFERMTEIAQRIDWRTGAILGDRDGT